ncbi:Alpha-ketoglutarate-dependent dioxygenase AlkB homolog [Linum perenne]
MQAVTEVNNSKLHPRRVHMRDSNSKRRRIRVDLRSKETSSRMENFEDCESSSLPTQFGKKRIGRAKKFDSGEKVLKSVNAKEESSLDSEPFDICQRSDGLQCLEDCRVVTKQELLRPGMVLLKHYIPYECQETSSRIEDFEDCESSLPTQFGKKRTGRAMKSDSSGRVSKSANAAEELLVDSEPFDICQRGSDGLQCLENVDRHVVMKQEVLRPGMVLLKHYIPLESQVEIVKTCRELGMGEGGFYRPGYQDGAKLRYYMMCLGFDWDPETRRYERRRRIDNAEAPPIPFEFESLVMKSIDDAHELIRKNHILPPMVPDICIANFYTVNGRLGLHQDRDESKESLKKGLPVVSFSIGDSAEFLYGDHRNKDMAEKVMLESGDVLIFGGESRHVFHGVSSIVPHSAPKSLVEETGLRDGRLNLTFRQY